MLRLPTFEVVQPTALEAALEALAEPDAVAVAGGTDLLPNLKHRLAYPRRLVSLARVEGLSRAPEVEADGTLVLRAGATLARVAADRRVRTIAPSLAEAAGRVASPLIRNMATIGGNVNLDTRCRYVNQTAFWRSAIGGCLKSEGQVCHVVPKGRNCVAALSSDTVPVLLSLDARLVQRGAGGRRRDIDVASYFHADGTAHVLRERGEITWEIRIPPAAQPRRTAYVKWSVRGSIDFPLVSVALRADLEEDRDDAPVVAWRVVAGVLGSKPRVVKVSPAATGAPLADPAVAEAVAEAVHRQCKPLENVPYEAAYRRKLARVLVRRAVARLGGRDTAR